MVANGTWWFESTKDSRWSCSGSGNGSAIWPPDEQHERFEEMKEEYGDPPDDLEGGFVKY